MGEKSFALLRSGESQAADLPQNEAEPNFVCMGKCLMDKEMKDVKRKIVKKKE